MPTLALDVIVVPAVIAPDSEGTWSCTDFYVKFSGFHPNKNAISELIACIQRYDVIAFNDVDRDAAVKEAAASAPAAGGATAPKMQSEKLKFSIPTSLSSRIEWVDLYRDGEHCKDVVALVSCDTPNGDGGHVLFFDKQRSTFSQNPCSEVLGRALQLQGGCNQMKAVVRANPTKTIFFDIYVYGAGDRIVVMDIDGTITISDVRGYVESVYLGRYTYVHAGIVPFLRFLRENLKCQVMYLTSRPIAHASETRLLLKSMRDNVDNGESVLTMPPGPLFLNKESKTRAAYRELVSKSVASFKSDVLLKIKSLFVAAGAMQPFFVGVGNKPTDMQAYEIAGIPKNSTLLIDPHSRLVPQGAVAHEKLSKAAGGGAAKGTTWTEVMPSSQVYITYSDPALIAYLEDLSSGTPI